MKIISLNTWMGIVCEPLTAFFRMHKDVDIFCLQEVYKNAEGKAKPHPEYDVDFNLFTHLSELFADTHEGYFEPTIGDYYGIAIFVKKGIEVAEHGGAFIYENPNEEEDVKHDPGNHNRRLQFIRITHTGASLMIVNVHGMYKGGQRHEDIPERIEQSKRIRAFLAEHPGRFVMAGDFNLDIKTEALTILDDGYQNLVREYGISSTRTRFYPKDDLYADYAIVSPEVSVTDFKVLPDLVSDHAALLIEIA
jgi:endonuclease/exonuclease/phosphatase family metal-dependent hydrolase